jgi:hypothetical protein
LDYNIDLYNDYLNHLFEIKDYVNIYIYSRDQIGKAYPSELADKLKKLGLKHDFDDKRTGRGHNWYAYGAVIKNGSLVFEKKTNLSSKVEYEDENVVMMSTCWNKQFGNLEPVFIDKNSNQNLWFRDSAFRGLIFVVYHNNHFEESGAFDVSRKKNELSKTYHLNSSEYANRINWRRNVIGYVSEKNFFENLISNNEFEKVSSMLLDKINSGNIQQDWVYSYYVGINYEYLRKNEVAQNFFEKYKLLISDDAPINKFMYKWNSARLYSKLILASYIDKHQYEIRNIANLIKDETNRFSQYPVFIYWGQGFNDAPPIVKAVYQRLQRVVPVKSLITLSEENIRDYIYIPEYVNKIRKEHYANYSDYIRFALLAKYGGAWVDATVYVSEDFYEQLIQYNNQPSKYPMDGPITVMGSWFRTYKQTSHLGEKMLQATTLFWLKHYSKFPFYFFIDFLEQYYADFKIEPHKERDVFFRKNDNDFTLRDSLSNSFDKEWAEKVLRSQPVHKLNYKLTDWEKLEKEDSLYRAIIGKKPPFNS